MLLTKVDLLPYLPEISVEGIRTRARMSPRRRAQLLRWVQYAVLAIVLLVAVFAANWHQIIDVFFRGNLVVETLTTSRARRSKNTIVYTAGAFAFGLVLGMVLALMRLSRRAVPLDRGHLHRDLPRPARPADLPRCRLRLPLAFPGFEVPGRHLRHRASSALGLVGGGLHGRDHPGGHPGRAQGADGGGPVAGHVARPGAWSHRHPAGVPDRHPAAHQRVRGPAVKDSSLVLFLGVSGRSVELAKFGSDLASQYANSTPILVAGLVYLMVTIPLGYAVRRWRPRRRGAR